MVRMKTIAATIVAALGMGAGVNALAIPAPGAVADAYLLIDNFRLRQGNNAAGVSGTQLNVRSIQGTVVNPAGTLDLTSVVTTAELSANVNGGPPATDDASVGLGVPFTRTVTDGAGFVAETLLTGDPTATFAGSHTSSTGNAITGSDRVPVHNQVSLTDFGTNGAASANQNLTTEFTVRVTGNPTRFELSFDAEGFLRAALGQPGLNATASYGWTAKVTNRANGQTILNWTPNGVTLPDILGVSSGGLLINVDGTCVAAGTCREFSDPFKLTDTLGTNSTNDFSSDTTTAFANKFFEIELLLAQGDYTFTIAHETNANASIFAVPEPGTVALLGAGLIGIAARRRKSA